MERKEQDHKLDQLKQRMTLKQIDGNMLNLDFGKAKQSLIEEELQRDLQCMMEAKMGQFFHDHHVSSSLVSFKSPGKVGDHFEGKTSIEAIEKQMQELNEKVMRQNEAIL
mmetsp:Transcript_10751/g.10872  ORF Transcript_10751/g.10872 Transcript_10751/m.10872 type:complete len:110 (+) Transcript_10751:157-486(+)